MKEMSSNKGKRGNGQQLGSKRARIRTIGEAFLEDNFQNEINKARKYFVKTEEEASVEKTSGTEHIIYFEPFLNHLLVIEKIPSRIGSFLIHIKPVDWAKSFIQLDIVSTAKCLQKAIVNKECWAAIKSDIFARKSIAKIIQIAVTWMMSKFRAGSHIDPWSFPSDFSEIMKLPHLPTEDESKLIQSAIIENHSKIVEILSAPLVEMEINLALDNILGIGSGFWNFDFQLPYEDDQALGEMGGGLSDDLVASMEEETQYYNIYKQFVAHLKNRGNSMNTAQIACVLTKSCILNNQDQFVDAVQFSDQRWRHAMREYNIARIGAKLSSTIIRLDFDDKNFSSIDDLCPVKRLAIYRGAKFIDNKRLGKREGMSDSEIFNSAIPEHNVYPTIEECGQIDKQVFLHAKSVLVSLYHLREMNSGTATSDASSICSSVQNNQSMDASDGSNDFWVGPSNDNALINDQTFPINETVSMGVEDGLVPILPYNFNEIPVGQVYSINILPRQGVENGIISPNLVPRLQNEAVQISNFESEDAQNLSIAEIPLKQLNAVQLNGGTEPNLKSLNCNESDVVIITVRDNQFSRSHAFSKSTWTKAVRKYETSGAITCGKEILLCNIFEENELKTAVPCGRRSPKYGEMGHLDENRQTQIIDALRYLIGKVHLQNSKLSLGVWSSFLESDLRKKVLNEGSSQIRARLNRK